MNETIGVVEINDIVGDKRQRGISAEFEGQLTDGVLRPILERLRCDDTLSLEIRNGYIDIYYRGGRLLNLRTNAKADRFATAFDERYCVEGEWCPKLPPNPGKTIASPEQAQAWVDVFAPHKQIMDIHFCASARRSSASTSKPSRATTTVMAQASGPTIWWSMSVRPIAGGLPAAQDRLSLRHGRLHVAPGRREPWPRRRHACDHGR